MNLYTLMSMVKLSSNFARVQPQQPGGDEQEEGLQTGVERIGANSLSKCCR